MCADPPSIPDCLPLSLWVAPAWGLPLPITTTGPCSPVPPALCQPPGSLVLGVRRGQPRRTPQVSSAQNHPANGSLWSQTRQPSPWETSGPTRASSPISRRSPLYSGDSAVKKLPAMQETPVRSLGLEDPPEKGENTERILQDSCLENPMDRGPWGATIHGVAKSRTRLRLTLSGWPVSSTAHL